MRQKTGRKLVGVMLVLAIVVRLLPGVSLTAYAAGATWNSSFTSDGDTISGGVDTTVVDEVGSTQVITSELPPTNSLPPMGKVARRKAP